MDAFRQAQVQGYYPPAKPSGEHVHPHAQQMQYQPMSSYQSYGHGHMQYQQGPPTLADYYTLQQPYYDVDQMNGHSNGNGHGIEMSNGTPIQSGSGSHYSTPPDDRYSPASGCGGGNVNGFGQQHAGEIGKWRGDKEQDKAGPVKNACLSCRSKKAKCDGGQPVCGQCAKKSLECVYVKSRRGGARKKKDLPPPSALQEFLKKLDGLLGLQEPVASPDPVQPTEDITDIVRQFASREEILNCYYNEVHPFLPVMPQRHHSKEILASLLPESPFLLAAQTILVLVPHAMDQNAKSANSKRLRVAMSTWLSQQTMLLVERLINSPENTSIECVQALTMLSLWEWGNTGNLVRNRARAGQAIQVAMDMGLHEMDRYAERRSIEGNWKLDMARRTWWTTYVAQLTAAMISGNEPVLGPDDPRVRVDFPVCSLNDSAWPNWINANRQCVRVFSLVNSVYYAQNTTDSWGSHTQVGSPEEHETMTQKMMQVDREVLQMMKQAEEMAVIELVPGGEEEVVRNQQLSTRLGLAVIHIHIHRQQAFPEVSLFSKQICGLPKAPDYTDSMPLLDNVSVPQALADGEVYSETKQYQAVNQVMGEAAPAYTDYSHVVDDRQAMIGEMWQPETYPEDLPAPWFAHTGGAAQLYAPTSAKPTHIEASIVPITSPRDRRQSTTPSINSSSKPHKAWGVDENDQAVAPPAGSSDPRAGNLQIFPPGISLARCATAAHTIVRLEVLHRSATIAMWKGPPKWLPFCACGLVVGAYAFLLLALAVQAETTFGQDSNDKAEEVDALLTNVKVILAGLEAYGQMWGGIEVMAGEVRAALEAATRLPYEVRAQIENASTASPGELGAVTMTQNNSGEDISQQSH